MSVTEKRTELLVGVFVFFGLAIMAVLILQFGRFGDRIRESYSLHVNFADATGIFDGVDVRLGGVKIGSVAGKPRPDEDLTGVIVPLMIFSDFQIPRNVKFRILTAGLMGDSYVGVVMPENPSTEYYQPNETVVGHRSGGLDALTDTAEALSKDASELMKELKDAIVDIRGGIDDLKSALEKLDSDVLGDENLDNVKEAITNFRELAENLNATSEKLDPVVAKAEGAVENANGTFEGAQEIVKDLEPVVADLKKATTAINQGDGLMTALLNDDALRRDFIALIANLKEHGVLKYKDTAGQSSGGAAPSTSPAPEPEKKKWRPFGRNR